MQASKEVVGGPTKWCMAICLLVAATGKVATHAELVFSLMDTPPNWLRWNVGGECWF